MSVVDSDIKVYGAANIPESDTGTVGGAIDTSVRYVFDDSALVNDPTNSGGDGTVKITSSNGTDVSQTVTIYGRDSGGSIVSEALALTGTGIVVGSQVFERILKVVIDSAHAGTVTLSDSANGAAIGNTIVDIESGVLTLRTPFYNVAADVSGGSARDFYEKVFVKNTNGVNSLLSMSVAESADPTTNVTFALEDAVDDSNTATNRVTAPTGTDLGASGFDSATKSLATETDASTADLAAGSAIGVWLKLSLAAGTAATKSTWTMGVTGSTT